MDRPLRAAVVGGTGYTGAELVRLLLAHPRLAPGPICGHSKAGQKIAEVLPSLAEKGDAAVITAVAPRLKDRGVILTSNQRANQ